MNTCTRCARNTSHDPRPSWSRAATLVCGSNIRGGAPRNRLNTLEAHECFGACCSGSHLRPPDLVFKQRRTGRGAVCAQRRCGVWWCGARRCDVRRWHRRQWGSGSGGAGDGGAGGGLAQGAASSAPAAAHMAVRSCSARHGALGAARRGAQPVVVRLTAGWVTAVSRGGESHGGVAHGAARPTAMLNLAVARRSGP